MPQSTETCTQCQKPIDSRGQGDLASFMLQSNYCQCDKTKRLKGELVSAIPARVFCPHCGLEKKESAAGSLTGYLFQDIRCTCEQDCSPGKISLASRFFNLNQTDPLASGAEIIPPGTVIGGTYKISMRIGRGGMGEVYLVKHIGLNKEYALKLIPPEEVTEEGWQRFHLEAKTLARLNHKNLVQVIDLGIHDGALPFYAMEYVEGKSLEIYLRENGPLTLEQAIVVFKQICDGVDHAHRAGVLHRDLKPANIMVNFSGDKTVVKILDFGLVKMVKHNRHKQALTAVGEVFGSPFYMSPEQCIGEKQDNRSDIYSIGCTLFECLTGKPPFTAFLPQAIMTSHRDQEPPSLEAVTTSGKQHLRELDRQTIESLEIIVAKLLRKNPVERYQTCAELKTDLEKLERKEIISPFYISRAVKADAPKPSGFVRQKIRGGAIGRRLWLTLGLTAVAVISLFAAGQLVAHRLFSKQPDVASQTITSAPARLSNFEQLDTTAGGVMLKTKDFDAHLDIPSAHLTTAYSKHINVDGKAFIEFSFPTDLQIGQIGPLTDSAGNGQNAIGKIRFPSDLSLKFTPWPGITRNENYFRRFRQGDFNALNIQQMMETNSVLHYFSGMPGYESTSHLNLIASPIKTFSNGKRPQHLDGESLNIIARCAIREIACTPAYIDINELARMPWLSHLKTLALTNGYDDIDSLLEKMKGSNALTTIVFEKSSDKSWQLLKTMPNLTSVILSSGIQSASQLIEAAKIKKLREIYLGNLTLTDSVLSNLSEFKNLTGIHLVGKNTYANSTMAQKLRTRFPNLTIVQTQPSP